MLAQTTQPASYLGIDYIAWIRSDVLIPAIIGAVVVIAIVVRRRYREAMKADEPRPPLTIEAVCLFVAGVGLAVLATDAVAYRMGIQEPAYVRLVAGGLGAFGVPITSGLIAFGDKFLNDPANYLPFLKARQPHDGGKV